MALSAPFIAGYFSAINTYVKEPHTSSNYFDTDFGTAKVVFDNYFSNRIVLDYLRHSLPIVVGSLLVAAIIYFFVRRYTLAKVLRSVGLDESKLSLSTDSNFDDPFVNPTSVDSPSEDSSDVEMYDTETSLVRICTTAKNCYDQFELIDDEIVVINFDNTYGYADCSMEVTSYDGMATNLIIKFAIPPNEENNEWAAYRVTIDSPENSPRFMSVIEIDQKGVETDLGLEYYEWLADCIDEVTVLPTIEQQPVRIAPVSMYWHS